MGPVEEEEEETGIASDVVKVEGEDPATPDCLREAGRGEVVRWRFSIVGTCSLGSLVKKPWDRSLIPQYWFNITKQHVLSRSF